MHPSMNRWQMALSSSVQAVGVLMGYSEYENELIDEPIGGATSPRTMCCLGVCMSANGVPENLLTQVSMPSMIEDPTKQYSSYDYLPIDYDLQVRLSIINDSRYSHLLIKELLIDFSLTGDPSPIIELSKKIDASGESAELWGID